MTKFFNPSRRFLSASVVAGVAVLAGAALVLAACGGKSSGSVSADDMSMGNPAAKVTVIEYASVTCAHCAAFNETVMPDLKKKYIDTGKINYVYREFLTPPVEVSAAGILLARCAGKDKYFEVIDAIFRAHDQMAGTPPRDVLLGIGKSAGLSEAEFDRCITDPKALERLQTNVDKYMKEENIDSTPTFIVNGKKLQRTKGDISDFDKAFADLGVK